MKFLALTAGLYPTQTEAVQPLYVMIVGIN